MDGFLKDLRQGVRMIVRTPLLSLVAIVTIGLGVGSTTFAFSVVYGSIVRAPDVRDADRLVILYQTNPSEGQDQMWVPWSDYLDFAEAQSSFEHLEASYSGTVNLAGDDGPPERFQGAFVTPGTLSMLGVPPVAGRTFLEEEGVPGATLVTVLGYDIWQNRFAGDPSVVGRTVRLNGETAEVVGVMPEGFRFPFNEDLWLPIRRGMEAGERRAGSSHQLTGYLAPGVALETATAEVAAIARRMEAEFPVLNEGLGARVVGYVEAYMPPEIRNMLFLIMAVGVGVLLVASANVANVLLARAAAREREVAIRSALGAGRWRVIRQLLAEALVLGVGGALVGLLLSGVGLELFRRGLEGVERPYWLEWILDTPALLFTSAVAILTAVAAGTLPALRASGASISTVLRDESRGSSSLRVGRLATFLVVAELAVSCGLMIAAGLMIKTLVDLDRVELGFEAQGVMTARVGLFETEYPDEGSRSRFFQEVRDRLAADPGIESATVAGSLPALGGGVWPIQVDGAEYTTESEIPRAGRTVAGFDYFETFRVPMAEGRGFTRAEAGWEGEPVAVVNQSFAREHLGGRALGRRIKVGGLEAEGPWLRVVGVVEDVYPGTGGPFGSGEPSPEAVYVPTGQQDSRFLTLVARSAGPATSAAGTLRETVASVDPDLPLYWVRSMEEAMAEANFMYRIFSSLFSIFGASALFLAAVGLYGVIDFSVSNRVREMGVRVALGASRADVVRLVLGKVLAQLALGAALGVGLGFALAVPLSSTLFGVETFDPLVYGVIVGTLFLTGVVAALVPIRRALAVDPGVALAAA